MLILGVLRPTFSACFNIEITFLVACFFIFNCLIECKYLIKEEELIPNWFDDGKENVVSFSNKWIIKADSEHKLSDVAEINGFQYHGQIDGFENFFLFENDNHPDGHQKESSHLTDELIKHENVSWAKQLHYKQLDKRDFQYDTSSFMNNFNNQHKMEVKIDNVLELYKQKLQSIQNSVFKRRSGEGLFDLNGSIISIYDEEFNDELWRLQWYEVGYRVNSTTPVLDMNIVPIYREYNITGNGKNVVIIDDGVEYTHEDIRENFNNEISFNLNMNKKDVMPRYEDPRNRHGTRCAGVIVMKANNTKCGVGIAYNANVGGITLLDGVTHDLMEARAVTFANSDVDIYSGSWGPQDNGKTMDGPGPLVSMGLYYGITKGRNGLGSLYVFAAGNGGIFGDHCGADGYINNIYTIAVASATQDGGVPYYGERCPAIIATTYSGSKGDIVKIVTTDIHNNCTLEHSGTSASAPILAGILALVLEANENVSWRDVQHLIIQSSEMKSLKQDVDWSLNGFGLWYTPQFGFGLVNAHKMITFARNWQNVPEKYVCSVPFILRMSRKISSSRPFVAAVRTNGCDNTIRYLEHVQLNATFEYSVRGHIEVKLISPFGTASNLLEPRKNDNEAKGFKGWQFMSLQFWGEQASGTWALVISDQMGKGAYRQSGREHVQHIQLILHGTKEIPNHYKQLHLL